MGQGGPFVKRDGLLITNVYEELPFAFLHGETVRKLEGFKTPESVVKTRTKVWTIKKKSENNEEAEAGALALSGASGSSRSSVNNCTEPQFDQIDDQLRRLLSPYAIRGGLPPNIDESALAALKKGSSVRIDDETRIRIRPAEVLPCGTVRPAQLAEEYIPKANLSWLDEFEKDPPKLLSESDYVQPDLSVFPEHGQLLPDWDDVELV